METGEAGTPEDFDGLVVPGRSVGRIKIAYNPPKTGAVARASFRILSEVGTRYVVFHLNGYSRSNRADLLERISRYQQFLRPLVQQDDVWLYEIVDWPN